MVLANNAAAVRFVAKARTTTAKPPRTRPKTSASNREILPRGIGRIAVRVMIASISASYHMLSTPAAPAPAAMARTAARVVSGSSRTGALLNPTSAVKTASIITRGLVRATKSDTRQWPASAGAESDDDARCARLSPSWPVTDLTLILPLRVRSKREPSYSVRTAAVQYSICILPSAPIERGCSIGANHAQNCQPTSSDLMTRVATARFRIIRARFNKRSTQAFSKGRPSFEYPQRAALQFEYRRGLLRLLGSGCFA